MNKDLAFLYCMIPVIILFGWFTAKSTPHEVIRGDCLSIAISFTISAIILTVGYLRGSIKVSARILQVLAIFFSLFTLTRLLLTADWAEFSWWYIPLGILILIILSIPAFIAFSIATYTIKRHCN